jgi:hypothetical protein
MTKLVYIVLAILVVIAGMKLSDNKEKENEQLKQCIASGGSALRGGTCVNFSTQPK